MSIPMPMNSPSMLPPAFDELRLTKDVLADRHYTRTLGRPVYVRQSGAHSGPRPALGRAFPDSNTLPQLGCYVESLQVVAC
jgi:hypothetical protein